jgi:glycosyltransferase involved in cell wall biosynthesis
MAALAPRYQALGVELEVVYLRATTHSVADDFEAAGATTRLVDLARLGRGRALGELTKLIRARKPDLVHTTLFEADVLGRVAARVAGTPVVSSIVNESYGAEHRADPHVTSYKLRGAHALDALTARLARRMHSLTEHAADVMATRLGYPRARIDVVGRGRDPEVLGRRSPTRGLAVRKALGVAADDVVILAAARQEYQKGLDVLLRAAPSVLASVPDARFVIAGRPGSESEALERLASTEPLRDRVVFLGARDDVPDLMAAADVFVVPSRREGFGSVLLEAMALEAPIVASDLPPLREVLGDDGGTLVPRDDSVVLAAAIERTLQDRAATQRRVRAAHARFEARFTTSAIGDQMVEFYTRALAR